MEPENEPRKGDSYWKPPFLGAMLVFRECNSQNQKTIRTPLNASLAVVSSLASWCVGWKNWLFEWCTAVTESLGVIDVIVF